MFGGSKGLRATPVRNNQEREFLTCMSQVVRKFSEMSDTYLGRSTIRVEESVRDKLKKAIAEPMAELKFLLHSNHN